MIEHIEFTVLPDTDKHPSQQEFVITSSSLATWEQYGAGIERVMYTPPGLPFKANEPLFGVASEPPYFAPSMKEAFTNPTYTSIFAINDEQVAGIILAGDYKLMYPTRKPLKKTAYIYAVGVLPEYDGLGISGILFDALVFELLNKGYDRAELHAHRDENHIKGYAEILDKLFAKKNGSIADRKIVTEKETRIFWEELGLQTRFMIQLNRYALSRNLI